MRLWDMVRGWVDQNSASYVYARLPTGREATGTDNAALKPNAAYLRLWLSELCLGKSVAWGKSWFPVVHAEVRLNLAGRETAMLSKVFRGTSQELGRGVRLNHPLTDLLPYNGGVVEVEAALLALQGENYLGTAIGVIQEFSALVGPPLSQALTVSSKVTTGVQELLSATQGGVHLGFHDAFVSEGGGSANVLRPGYLAVVLARPQEVKPDGLEVHSDRLLYGDPPKPLEGYDYLLFRIEGRAERDDWHLPDIDEPLQEAIIALAQGKRRVGDAYEAAALAAAMRCPEFVSHDRRRVVTAIKDELASVRRAGFGAVGGGIRPLGAIMEARAMPLRQAAALGAPSPEEVFSSRL